MWYILSHMLQKLTDITPENVKFKWTDVEQNAFDELKGLLARDTL